MIDGSCSPALVSSPGILAEPSEVGPVIAEIKANYYLPI